MLDNSMFGPFDTTIAGNMVPSHHPGHSFAPTPVHHPPHAGSAEPPLFSEGTTGNPPRERMVSGNTSNTNNTSNLTEFTKRPNWPAKVIEELQDLLHILDANGRIKSVSPSAKHLTGYTPSELRDSFMRDLLHPDDVGVFTSELNESIASGAPLRVFYRLRKKDGNYVVFESVGHAHIAAAKFAPNPNNQTPFCQAVFIMSRPYPTKKAALLDSFLEHKMENERLKRKIAELQREAQDEEEESERTWHQSQEIPPSNGVIRLGAGTGTRSQTLADPSISPRDRRTSIDTQLPPETITGARHPPAMGSSQSHADTIEMLTGLRYQDGERSRGITTGNPSPALITGDAGIAIPVDRDARAGEKKKKLKVAEEYVCTDCGKLGTPLITEYRLLITVFTGTLESPEWRKGPSGPKTLCNACGLRWAKKEKKKNVQSSGAGAENHHESTG